MAIAKHRVLDVGNCNPDHYQIRMMLERHFDVAIDRVMFVDEALEKMRQTQYDLVLFNRVIFEDGSDGLELVRRAKADPTIHAAPMMMVSNHPEAQAQAVAAGAVEGFGKASTFAPGTVPKLAWFLKQKAQKEAKHAS